MESVVEPLSIRLKLPELRITGVEETGLGSVYSEETLLLEMVEMETFYLLLILKIPQPLI